MIAVEMRSLKNEVSFADPIQQYTQIEWPRPARILQYNWRTTCLENECKKNENDARVRVWEIEGGFGWPLILEEDHVEMESLFKQEKINGNWWS